MSIHVALPGVALALGALAGYLNWQSSSHRAATAAATESEAAAGETATALLSYKTDTVENDLNSARDRLTGSFLAEYTKLVNEVVIPGSKEKRISATAQAPAAASVSATSNHAVALVFVDQTVTVGIDKVGYRWLASGFEPVWRDLPDGS